MLFWVRMYSMIRANGKWFPILICSDACATAFVTFFAIMSFNAMEFVYTQYIVFMKYWDVKIWQFLSLAGVIYITHRQIKWHNTVVRFHFSPSWRRESDVMAPAAFYWSKFFNGQRHHVNTFPLLTLPFEAIILTILYTPIGSKYPCSHLSFHRSRSGAMTFIMRSAIRWKVKHFISLIFLSQHDYCRLSGWPMMTLVFRAVAEAEPGTAPSPMMLKLHKAPLVLPARYRREGEEDSQLQACWKFISLQPKISIGLMCVHLMALPWSQRMIIVY